MDNFLSAINKNSYTENGALTNATSFNKCLDLFSIIGDHNDHSEDFNQAFSENPQTAIRILFWSRDCRGGAGSRKTFQEVLSKLQKSNPDVFSKIFKFIPIYGYWKDIFKLLPSGELVEFVANTLKDDKDHSLCAKYMPRKGLWFYTVRKKLSMTPSAFRHFIVNKTQVVEQLMCSNNWSDIDYSTVPSIASLRYRNIFYHHDSKRYAEFVKAAAKGEAKVNASVLYPSDLYREYLNRATPEDIIARWDALPNFMEGCVERILPVCDVSGSMRGTPMHVSIGLGCYISEKNEGAFHNAFITFSHRPQLQYLTGDNIVSRFCQLARADWGMNTNLEAVFKLILDRAKLDNVAPNEMPTKILIISDMEFDAATKNTGTLLDTIKQEYANSGYTMPGIIFWNVNGRSGNIPATKSDLNVGLVSGYSPSIMTNILQAKVLTPIDLMMNTVNSRRYSVITI